MTVVVDTNVIVSAIFWPGESRECLVHWAKHRFHLAVSIPLFEEYSEIARKLARTIPQVDPEPWLNWIELKAKVYEPAPLGKQRSRDRDDDQVLARALASGAETIISKDSDLLILRKPFGIEIVTPRQFIERMRKPP
ncbi:MAG TPA: putative toxin-antitoxin system toxin component, PIN family [Verrucomicrobiae bacterium]|jgi:putative PIN family toxin of toxin-antitoxin system|nr:putative toxin-antitoxin system toxin component, PIN family [Verrucomicrobiae bacterium]